MHNSCDLFDSRWIRNLRDTVTDVHTDMCLLEGCLVTVVASVDKANDKLLDVVVDKG